MPLSTAPSLCNMIFADAFVIHYFLSRVLSLGLSNTCSCHVENHATIDLRMLYPVPVLFACLRLTKLPRRTTNMARDFPNQP